MRHGEDPWADIDSEKQSIEPLLEMVKADEERGLGDMPYPPSYPKMPGEPPRVQPSKKVAENWDGRQLTDCYPIFRNVNRVGPKG